MIKKSLAFGVLLICLSLVFNFTYSQTSTTSSSTTSTSSEESGDVYTRANETYKYVSSFDGSEDVKTFDNQNTRDVGSVFNYLLTVMAVAIVLLVIYRLIQGAVIKGTFDNIYDQTKGRSYIKTAGTALIVFIFAYAILSFINPDLTGWTVATKFIGQKRIEGLTSSGGMCTGNTLANTNVEQLIRQHEGFVACPYKDSRGIATIGIGYNLTNSTARNDLKNAGVNNIDEIMNYQAGSQTCPANAPKITEEQALKLLENYLPKARAAAVDFAGGESEFRSHPQDMQKILIDMSYNMGSIRFPDMQAALKNHDYVNVAKEMVDSDWYKQVGDRAKQLVEVVKGFTCKTGNSGSVANQKNLSKSERCEIINSIKKSDLVVVGTRASSACVKDTNLYLTSDVAAKFKEMQAAAKKENINIVATQSYRSEEEQICIRNQYNCTGSTSKCPGGKLVAVPCGQNGGGSNHQLGNAVDISYGVSNCTNGISSGCKNSPVYNWLKKNASIYGFFQSDSVSASDPVHWSTTGN